MLKVLSYLFNIKLTLSYDGTNYLGWQKTNTGPSIEETLEQVLEKLLQEKIVLQAASRTDAHVHAVGQVVNFFTNKERDLNLLLIGLNALLPKDIAVFAIEKKDPQFHPTLDVIAKEYRYYICYDDVQQPKERLYSWHVPFDLNIEAMEKASLYLIGTHDFSSFCNVKKNATYKDYIRTVHSIEIEKLPQKRLQIKILGHHFLYKMVRNIVGTLIYVGKEKILPQEIPLFLNDRDRKKIGMTAPAHGLFLHEISY